MANSDSAPFDFFISYSPADERWAAWIAWTLEEAGHRTLLQAWDFVPGTDFIDFMDRGVTESTAVIAVLSDHYKNSTYGRMEWQAALRSSPQPPNPRLLTVRVADTTVEGLLATITYIDLVGVQDAAAAKDLLLTRIESTVTGRSRPEERPRFPGDPDAPGLPGRADASGPRTASIPAQRGPSSRSPFGGLGWGGRRRPTVAPRYPAAPHPARADETLTVLHLAGPAFGRGQEPDPLRAAIWSDLVELTDGGAPAPDLVVVTGDLTASGSPRECDQALDFLTKLRSRLALDPQRLAVVPGGHDVSQAACRAYFHSCEADEIHPRAPYWPKWRHYTRLFQELYQGLDLVFDADQPWSLFPVPDLHTVVAGFNSSMAYSHRSEDQFGSLGNEQITWFAQALRPYQDAGWLRIGAVRHPLDRAPRPRREALRDSDLFLRLAAPRLNLLLHGPDTAADAGTPHRIAVTGGELLVLGAKNPAERRLVQLSADDLRSRQAGSQTVDLPAHWSRAETAFPPAGHGTDGAANADTDTDDAGSVDGVDDVDAAVAGPGHVAPETRAFTAPVDELLDRIAEVSRTRHESVTLRRLRGTPPQLLATWQESGFVRQQRIGAVVGTPDAETVEAFADQVRASGTAPDAELVHLGPAPASELRDRARRLGVRIRSFTEFQGLLDLREYTRAQTERLLRDNRYPPHLYLPQRYRETAPAGGVEHPDLIGDLIRLLDTDHGRFLLLLGDFGHGKTFALHELARRLPEELPHITPLLIDLGTLDKAYTLDGLVAAHLAAHGVDTIELRAFRYMLRQGRIILLFDGFDELVNQVSYDRAADHLQVLLDAATDNAKIVVSSRTQHFKSQAQVLTALGERVGLLPQRRVMQLESFNEQQIRRYLENRYGDAQAADDRMRLLHGIPDLLALCGNPRLLSFVSQLDEERLRAVAGAGRALSAAGLYQEVFDAWLQYEYERVNVPGAPPGLTVDQLWHAASALAVRLWETGRTSLRMDELTDIAEILGTLTEHRLSIPHAAHAMGSGTLLIRSPEGTFHFIHRSVADWLVAREAAARLARGDHELLEHRVLSQLTVEFLCDLADRQVCLTWAQSVLRDAGTEQETVAQANAAKVISRLRIPAHTDLRGARLVGEDLSHRDFTGVDLTGADLSDARLDGANFKGARLRDARLVGTTMDGTRLTDADLTGADLRRSRLGRSDLSGARLTGSRWNRASLIDCRADRPLTELPELATAAFSPGMPVEIGLRPAKVGVPYGFGSNVARLPEPLTYAPDGELLAIGNEDGSVLVCDAVTGAALRTLSGHTGRVYSLKFRPGVLATGASDGTVRLWDPVTGACLHRLDVHPDGVWPVTLDQSGTLLATGDPTGAVTLWDVATGTVRLRLPGHGKLTLTAQFSADGRLLALGDASSRLTVWDTTDGRRLASLEAHDGTVYRARFSPDGRLLATGDQGTGVSARNGRGLNGNVRVWSTEDWSLLHHFTGHPGRVYTLDFHPSGTLLASGDTEGSVRLWDLVSGRPAGVGVGCVGSVYQVSFSPDGGLLAAGDSTGLVRVWQSPEPVGPGSGPGAGAGAGAGPGVGAGLMPRASGPGSGPSGGPGREPDPDPLPDLPLSPLPHQPPQHRGSVWVCRFRPPTDGEPAGAGPVLVTLANDGAVRLWDTATSRSRRILNGHGRKVFSTAYSPDGSLLAVAGNDGRIRLWNTATGVLTSTLRGNNDQLVSAVFAPVDALLATASNDGDVYLWNAVTGEFQREIDAETDHTWAEAFDATGDILATANDDDSVQLWYRTTGARVASLAQHQGRVRSIAFSPDGSQVVTAADDRLVRVWNLQGELLAELAGHTDRVYAVVFGHFADVEHGTAESGDHWMASASWDGTAVVWRDGEPVHRLRGHAGGIWTAAAHPSLPLLATAGDDGLIRLWDVRAGTLLHTLTGPVGRVLTLSFRPDGGQLAAGGEDGTLRLWSVEPDATTAPVPQATLIGAAEGWAAFTPSGRYKHQGSTAGEFWQVIGMSRFEPGELDRHLPSAAQLPLDQPL
ncbi:WD40 domain-containing protein [Streptacidiphilus fuscans]|uniref:TIR domain-containing protein n=1 Tax=Streptacidiphilus fuscans TaxID=2789292 RepID=A0A931FFU2_9ACTN|nr:TIR domain-containing protein [Streptacidiphilus fuscans]MBF9071973.1 TIR domain-containing protein [Streptacidiphilus fuscans]